METFIIMTRVKTFTATSGQTHHPVIGYLYDARKARANRKPPTVVGIECSLVDDDVFWHNMVVFPHNELTEIVTRLYATNDCVDMGRYLQAVVTADAAKAGAYHKQCQSVVTALLNVGIVIRLLEALSQIDAITKPPPVRGWSQLKAFNNDAL